MSIREMLNTLNAQQNKDNHFTNITKEDLNMKATENKPASRPATFTKSEWDKLTYRAYFALLDMVKGSKTMTQFTHVPEVKALVEKCGITLDTTSLVSLLAYMVKYTTQDGNKVCKVSALSSLRKWFNEGYLELMTRPVVFNAGKVDPYAKKAKAPSASKKSPTKAELQAEIESLKAQLAKVAA